MELESPAPKGPSRSWKDQLLRAGPGWAALIASCKTNNNNTITRSNNMEQFIRIMLQLQATDGDTEAGTQRRGHGAARLYGGVVLMLDSAPD